MKVAGRGFTVGGAGRSGVAAANALASREADVVLANILANVLVDLSPLIGSLVRPSGELVLSGILQHQAQDVARAYEPAIHLQPPAVLDGWVRLQGVRA